MMHKQNLVNLDNQETFIMMRRHEESQLLCKDNRKHFPFSVPLDNRELEIDIVKDMETQAYAFHEENIGTSTGFRTLGEVLAALQPWLDKLAKHYNLNEAEICKVKTWCALVVIDILSKENSNSVVKPWAKPVQVGEAEIVPLTDTYTPIHPAIGVANDTAYVGVWLPCRKTFPPKKEGQAPKVKIVNKPYLVTEKGELILANNEILNQRGWILEFTPVEVKTTWEKVTNFLNGDREVNPVKLLEQILGEYKNYIEFSDEREYLLHALWDIGTYFHILFNSFPYLYVGGIKRCGKSKVLTLHSLITFNAFFSNNMSTSSIYRLIRNTKGTLLIDETEKLSNPEKAQEFRSIILSGYKKGAVVYRVEKTRKETYVPEAFEVYGPKALANIQGLEDVLGDRCIVTIMKRGKDHKVTDREVNTQSEHWSELKHRLHILFLLYWREILEIYEKINELGELSELVNFLEVTVKDDRIKYLTARELELWKPLFAIAKFFDMQIEQQRQKNNSTSTTFTYTLDSLCTLLFSLALDKAEQKHLENMTETGEAILVQVLYKMYEYDGYYKVKDICEEMRKQYDEDQKWLTTKWVGNALRRLGFSDKRRVGTGYEYRITKNEILDIAERLGITSDNEATVSIQKPETENPPKDSGREENQQISSNSENTVK